MKKNIIHFVGRARKSFGILVVGVATVAGAAGLSSFRSHVVKPHAKAFADYYWFTVSGSYLDEATPTAQVSALNADPPTGYIFSTTDNGGTAYEDGFTTNPPGETPSVIIYKNPS